MPELPVRPNIDQLRRQARELQRAAGNGEPDALTRIRAVSQRITLSAAQLAIAREYGFPSWPGLRAAVERRRATDRWAFGGAETIDIAAGMLTPRVLIIGPELAVLEASLLPSADSEGPDIRPRRSLIPVLSRARRARARADDAMKKANVSDVIVTDDRGASYSLRLEAFSGGLVTLRGGRQVRKPHELRLGIDPVPPPECRWLELRTAGGSATRLLPSARPAVRITEPISAAPANPLERELSELAEFIIGIRLNTVGQDDPEHEEYLRRQCSDALAKAAAAQQSGELDTASELPGELARLCAALTGDHQQASDLPRRWQGMLNAAGRTDGPRLHLDLGTRLPPVNDTAVQLDSLISEPDSWYAHMRATPGWWTRSEDGHHKWAVMSVRAEDDLGGTYLSNFGGSTGHGHYEELALRFLPRLGPRASVLKLAFTAAHQEVTAEISLAPGS
jgi:hypothetical protein